MTHNVQYLKFSKCIYLYGHEYKCLPFNIICTKVCIFRDTFDPTVGKCLLSFYECYALIGFIFHTRICLAFSDSTLYIFT
jgi:hypothetical protein